MDVEERVKELEGRVQYLEQELDLNYEKYCFKRDVEYVFRDYDCDEIYVDEMSVTHGYVATVHGITLGEVTNISRRIEDMGYLWKLDEEDGELIMLIENTLQ